MPFVLMMVNILLMREAVVRSLLALGFGAALALGPAAAVLADGGYTFRNCSEARAAGYTNIRRGTYGYGPHLDRDNDGIGCES
jgi:hypothetical protein